jgi:hypothetical protein
MWKKRIKIVLNGKKKEKRKKGHRTQNPPLKKFPYPSP